MSRSIAHAKAPSIPRPRVASLRILAVWLLWSALTFMCLLALLIIVVEVVRQ